MQWHVQEDGSHFADKWQRFSQWETDPALLQRLVLDVFRAGESSEQGHLAVVAYPMEVLLPLVRCPGLMLYVAPISSGQQSAAAPLTLVTGVAALQPGRDSCAKRRISQSARWSRGRTKLENTNSATDTPTCWPAC